MSGVMRVMDIDFDELVLCVDRGLIKVWEGYNLENRTTLQRINGRKREMVNSLIRIGQKRSVMKALSFLIPVLSIGLFAAGAGTGISLAVLALVIVAQAFDWKLSHEERPLQMAIDECESPLLDFKRDVAKLNPGGTAISFYDEHTIRRLLVGLALAVLRSEGNHESIVKDKTRTHRELDLAKYEADESRLNLAQARRVAQTFGLSFSNTELFNQAKPMDAG